MLKDEKILHEIDVPRLKGLEIGPLDKPLVSKTRGEVYYVDRAPTRELKKWYATNPNVTVDNIQEVDFIWGDRPLADCVGRDNPFDYCVASHVIEHIPDLIGWFREIADVLKDGGIASFAIPDKRYTLDIHRPKTTPADLIEAYFQKLKKPSARHIFDHFSTVVDIDVWDAWNPDFNADALKPTFSLKHAFNACRRAVEEGRYIDSHCWVFTSASFIEVLKVLSALGLFDFKLRSFIDVEKNTFEFIVQFEKIPAQATDAEKHAIFMESLYRANPHRVRIAMTSSKGGMGQLYYALGTEFNEIQSVSQPLDAHAERHDWTFDIPPVHVSQLRVDFTMAMARLEIHSVDLFRHGRERLAIPLENLYPIQDFISFECTDGRICATTADGVIDPSIGIAMTGLSRAQVHYVRIRFSCAQGGTAHLYYDSGGGFCEPQSLYRKFRATDSPLPVDFILPAVTCCALRLDVILELVNDQRPDPVATTHGAVGFEITSVEMYRNGLERFSIPLDNLYPIHDFSKFERMDTGIHTCIPNDATGASLGISMAGVHVIPVHYVRIWYACSEPGPAQLYYDSGRGYHEEESVFRQLGPRDEPMHIDFMIPPVALRSLRFDPLPGDTGDRCVDPSATTAEIKIESVDLFLNGMERHGVPLANLYPIRDFSTFEITEGAIHAQIQRDTADPSIGISMIGVLRMPAHYVRISFCCSKGGTAQLYYDSGGGYSEAQSVCHELTTSETPIQIDFEIPPTAFRSLRFDPIRAEAEIKIWAIDIFIFGNQHHPIPFARLKPVSDIAAFRVTDGVFYARTTVNAGDPSIEIDTSGDLNFNTEIDR